MNGSRDVREHGGEGTNPVPQRSAGWDASPSTESTQEFIRKRCFRRDERVARRAGTAVLLVVLSLLATNRIAELWNDNTAATLAEETAAHALAKTAQEARECTVEFENMAKEAQNLREVLTLTSSSWQRDLDKAVGDVENCEKNLQSYRELNKQLDADLNSVQVAVGKKEASEMRDMLSGRAVAAVAELSGSNADELRQLSAADFRNTMIVVISMKITDGTSEAELQGLTFGGLVRKAEGVVRAKNSNAGVPLDCNEEEDPAFDAEMAHELRRVLQEMRDEVGESSTDIQSMCTHEVRNSLIIELWSRTKIAVAGLQALDNYKLTMKAKEALRKGILPRG